MKKKLIAGLLTASMIVSTFLSGCGTNTSQPAEGTTEAAVSAQESTEAAVDNETGLPAKFDLRDEGFVTPVKFQNPWGSCWAFGGTAAAEISILSMLGMTNEEYKEKTGSDMDLSEKHLIWFSRLPISKETNEKQAGEGLHVIGWEEDGDQFVMYDGGDSTLITSLFATGVGPVIEEAFPYKGKNGITEYDYYSTYDKDSADVQAEKMEKMLQRAAYDLGITIDEGVQAVLDGKEKAEDIFKVLYDSGTLDSSFPEEGKSKEELVSQVEKAYYDYRVETVKTTNYYTANDDWKIDTYVDDKADEKIPNRDYFSGFTLLHGNLLPETVIRDEDYNCADIDMDAVTAIKKELQAGRAVSIRFYADQSVPGQEVSANGYMDQNTWAQYTFEDQPVSHGVCIVGWDDSISKDMFNKDPDKQPPADGAWIVKNSWGSETETKTSDNGEVIGYKDWGIENDEGKHTGYFYLSYYDKTIEAPESMEFDKDFMDVEGEWSVWAHDYMPCTVDWTDQSGDLLKTANVFENDTDQDQEIRAVSTRTAYPDATVNYSIYLLNEDAKNPEDGELLCEQTATYPYRGFHREKLDTPVEVKDGQKISVVVTEQEKDDAGKDQYSYVIVTSNTKKYAEETGYPCYGVPVIHEGESFVYKNGEWSDWNEALPEFEKEHETTDKFVMENFSIKTYNVPK